ncbi:MAG TPA: hypothetical protein VEQ63_02950 [Bryobacteraceae bacterium]|nr:hypothetical protein [Bryobacteraceae bacterium]
MIGQIRAILWAQRRALYNHRGKGYGRFPLAIVLAGFWYCLWAVLAFGVARLLMKPLDPWLVTQGVPAGLLLVFGYWQLVPVMMASGGLTLDLNRIAVYPVPKTALFTIEVLLRITTCFEMLIVLLGAMAGVLLNPQTAIWGILPLAVFAVLNLYLSVGLRDLLVRLLTKKGIREIVILGLVLLTAIPQLLLSSEAGQSLKPFLTPLLSVFTPWGATAGLMFGRFDLRAALALLFWTAAFWTFGRSQFEASLRFDAAEARASDRQSSRFHLLDQLLHLASKLLPDPIAALLEKEVRVLSRAPRFRLLFLMGFSFGLMLWLPFTLNADPESVMQRNYLTLVSVYALMLLGEVCFWNIFGMDRSAAQNYFVLPVRLAQVLIAKNIAAVFFILLDVALVTVCSMLFRVRITAAHLAEAMAVTVVITVFLLSIGNVLSTRYPRAIDPTQSWRAGSVGRVQAYLLLIYPATGAPILLAYGARYAFDTDLAFYGVLLVDLLIGALVYSIAMDSAVHAATTNREELITALASGHGPVGS